MKTISRMGAFVSAQFVWFVLAAAAIAYFQPNLAAWVIPYVPYLLGVVMFGMGMTLKRSDFAGVFKAPKEVTLGVVAHYLIMPVCSFAVCALFQLPDAVAAGVILVGCCPSGTAANVMCYLSKGDVALGVSIGTMTTFIAPIMLPVLLLIFAGHWVSIPVLSLFINVLEVVVLPIGLGLAANALLGKRIAKATAALPLVSTSAILLIIGGVVAANSARLFAAEMLILIPVVVLINVLGTALGFLAGKLFAVSPIKNRAITFEVSTQNSALGLSLALLFFSPAAAVPGTLFSVWQNISGPILASYWAGKTAKEETLKSEQTPDPA
ncbi:bile acid:sodium symporter family protein [Sporolactobacillus shoreicorticis]|uniref:Bile acid:sodium symporter family protein n=1 Tax=Sporolactobacillus shoreicorticis TaxID=1923877 RepID=A0ABW5S6W1_9BACL|nr:bile acid:sodium symporter family protein [Sporolactobacillus shoreicorticis]MCO7125577.1 bile acid:sodium symporter family protein [Sporolactobacillus shoreicorticis]